MLERAGYIAEGSAAALWPHLQLFYFMDAESSPPEVKTSHSQIIYGVPYS